MVRRILALLLIATLAGCGAQASSEPTAPAATTAPTPMPTFTPAPTSPATATPAAPEPATPEPNTPTPAATAAITASPEQQHIAPAYIIDADGVVSVWNLETGLASAVARLPKGYQHTLSPDGRRLIWFGEDQVGLADLQTGAITSSAPLEFQAGLFPETGFHWSANSADAYFESNLPDLDPQQPAIFRTNALSATTTVVAQGIGPAPSPDGQMLAFAGAPFEYPSPWGGGPGGILTLALPDGTQARPISDTSTFYPGWQPVVWSADSTRVAAGDSVVNAADGTLAWKVPEAEQQFLATITWLAADGRSAVVWRNLRYNTPDQDDPGTFDEADEFALVNEDGSERVLVRTPGTTCPCIPIAPGVQLHMSPDGSRALISGAVENESNTGVWLLDVASGEGLMLTSEGGVQEESSASLWSPDGKYTLLLGGENGVPHTWVFPLDGGLPFNLGAGTPLGWAR